MKVRVLFVPVAVAALFALAFLLPGMPTSWNLPDDILVIEDLWQSSSLSESLTKNPAWRAVKIVAEVTAVRDPLHVIPDLHAGDVITGTYVFDSEAADTASSDPTVARYQFSDAPFGVTLSVGRYTFRTNPRDVDFDIDVSNREYGDSFSFMSRDNICQPALRDGDCVGRVGLIWWRLHDLTGANLSSDELPTEPPVVAAWESLNGLRIEGTAIDRKTQAEGTFLIVAKVLRAETLVP